MNPKPRAPSTATGAPLNIASCLPLLAARHPDKIAIFQPRGDGHRAISYRELDEDSDAIARGLAEIGVGRGLRTVLMVPPGDDFFALAFGMAKGGVVPVLVDPGMGLSNLKACLAEAEPEAFIGVPKAHAARVALGWGKSSLRHQVTVGGVGLFGGHSLESIKRRGRSSTSPVLAETRADETAAILFTSGSTGCPKGAVYTHGNFAAQVEILRRISQLGSDEVDLATFPPFALFDPALGMTTVLPRMDFSRPAAADPARLVATILEFGVTNLFCSPALLAVIARWAAPRGIQLPSLRRVISAGAPVPAAVMEQFVTLLSASAQILTPYGATEALPVSVIGSAELLGETRRRTELGGGVCVGRPVDGVDVEVIQISDEPIASWSDQLRVPTGEIGELIVRGEVVTQAYFGRPRESSLAKIGDERGAAWHRMGDLGYRDATGRLWFCGRKSERVELPDEDARCLYTTPVEAIFDLHPSVRRSALVRVERDGRALAALCVELEPDLGKAARTVLRDELLALGAVHAHTRLVRTVLVHPGFPVDSRHNAKIRREELAAWAAARLR